MEQGRDVDRLMFWCYLAGYIAILLVCRWSVIGPWLGTESAPAWVQAIGSIGAILAAIYVVDRQHRKTVEFAAATRRDHEMLQCNRALLACYGDLNTVLRIGGRIAEQAKDPSWPFSCSLGTSKNWLMIDLDSLAFLVARQAQDLLNVFSVLRAKALRWNGMLEGLAEFQAEVVDPRMEPPTLKRAAR